MCITNKSPAFPFWEGGSFFFLKMNPPKFSEHNMPDTSQLLTIEPFTNKNNTNKFILNFSMSDCITKNIKE